jgi:phosphatidate cytidylyltransferase
MHRKRVIVALLLMPLLYGYVMYLPPVFFLCLLVLASGAALVEFYTLTKVEGVMRYASVMMGSALLIVRFYAKGQFAEGLLLCILLVMAVRLFSVRDPSDSVPQVSAAVLGLVYIPGLLAFQLDLAQRSPVWIILLYASVWAADSAAYYVGKGIGKKRLYEEVSPNKTVAGAYGSVCGGVLGAVVIWSLLMPTLSLGQAALIGACVGTTTIIGDLVESMFKRDAGIKDSGTILPGHGGLLDKLDGVTFAGPAMYWLCLGLGLIQ